MGQKVSICTTNTRLSKTDSIDDFSSSTYDDISESTRKTISKSHIFSIFVNFNLILDGRMGRKANIMKKKD
jgi:hypothetical protein